MQSDLGSSVHPESRQRRAFALAMQVIAGAVFVVGCAFMWGLAITDGPALLDYIRDSEGTPSWLTAKWVAMSDAASLDPWRWYGMAP